MAMSLHWYEIALRSLSGENCLCVWSLQRRETASHCAPLVLFCVGSRHLCRALAVERSRKRWLRPRGTACTHAKSSLRSIEQC